VPRTTPSRRRRPRRTPAWWLFWGSAATILYTYAGYPLSVLVRGTLRPREVLTDDATPAVSLVIAAYNEVEVITSNLESAFGLDYPADRLQIIVASDGSDDGTNELLRAWDDPRLVVLELPRGGKNAALNAAVPHATGEIIAFTDADTVIEPGGLRALVAPFADPSVGAVSGDYRYPQDIEDAAGERAYWSFDRRMKRLQSLAGTMISATGAFYAIRRELFRPVPPGVSDDFFISVGAVEGGQRIVFAPDAVVTGPVTVSDDAEFQRKVRVIARGLLGVREVLGLLDPVRHGFYALQLGSQKVVRRLVGVPLLVAALTAPRLVRRGPLYQLAVAAQAGLHGLALAGFLLRRSSRGRARPLALPFYLDMVNVAGIVAAWQVLTGGGGDTWTTERAADDVA
jgi:Glycosyl transferase family 2